LEPGGGFGVGVPDTGNPRREAMPVILLWAVPAIFVLGGVTYMIVK
jgi:hypothetical protein